MKVNWEALGITIGLIMVAVSILVVGLMARTKMLGLTVRAATLEKQIETGVKRNIIAHEYAFSKARCEKRAITLDDLKEGYALADKFIRGK